MTADDRRVWWLASLVPLVALMGGVVVGVPAAEHNVHLDGAGFVTGLPISAAFVSVPSALPLVVARRVATKLAVLAIMTATAATAGWLIATTDDAQAGLAILLVPYVAIPLALALRLGQHLLRLGAWARARHG